MFGQEVEAVRQSHRQGANTALFQDPEDLEDLQALRGLEDLQDHKDLEDLQYLEDLLCACAKALQKATKYI